MWETIGNVLTSANAKSTLLFLAVCIIGALVLIKSGMLQVHTEAVRLGAADRERNIIRQQLDWVRLHLMGLEASLEKPEWYNTYLGKYVAELVYDEYVNWVTFNHLSKSPAYISIKQDRIVDLVKSTVIREEYKSKDFEDFLRKDTEECILALLQIREVYK